MRFIFVLSLILFFSSCASKTKKDNYTKNVDKISNADFSPPNLVKYSKDRDRLDSKIPGLTVQESHEEHNKNSFKDNVYFQLAKLCDQDIKRESLELNDQSSTFIQKNFRSHQEDPLFWNQVGVCYMQAGNYKKSLLYFNYGLELKKDYAPIYNNLAVMYYNQQEYQKAIAALNKSIGYGPFSLIPRLNRASMLVQFYQTDLAVAEISKLLNKFPADSQLQTLNIQVLIQQNKYQKALELCKQFNFSNKEFRNVCDYLKESERKI
jgi:tetratricopeptide (TPR) repeat protein